MFTGIVQSVGEVAEVIPQRNDVRLRIATPASLMQDCRQGDSIAVSGVCLTALEPTAAGFFADVSAETRALTTLGSLGAGSRVNLEPAMRLSDRLGGHLVSGHVDGIAALESRAADGNAERLVFRIPPGLARYVVRKGSVTLDGVSLTVNDVAADTFGVCLIPHTLEVTTLGTLQVGSGVNLEVDLVARYLERMLEQEMPARAPDK